MLKLSTEHRPRQLLAVYVEPRRVEVLRAHRQWRSWQIDAVEHFGLPQGDSLFDALQRLNLRPRDRKATTLILFLPLTFYTFHCEHYPSGLQDQLLEALNYDWQENIFLEHDRTLHFPGPASPLNHHVSVPIFALQREVFEKFEQVLGAANFQSFRVIPSALMYRAFLASQTPSTEAPLLEIYARPIDASHLEFHRFYQGQLLDSTLFDRSREELTLFLDHRRSTGLSSGEDDTALTSPIHLICVDGEAASVEAYRDLCGDATCFDIQTPDDTLVSPWIRYLINLDQIQTFDAPLIIKPWQFPRITWPLLALLLLYSAWAIYQTTVHRQFMESSRQLKKEIVQYETQWKPIEQLQTRIGKFLEDQKTLSEFNREGYPLYEVLSVLSQTTPDDTWLNYFSIRKGQVVLRGDSKSAIKFLSELSKVEGFSDVRFASPVTRSPTSEDERFNVQYQLDPEKLKKTVDAMDLYKQEETGEQVIMGQEPMGQEALGQETAGPKTPAPKVRGADTPEPAEDDDAVVDEEGEEGQEEEDEGAQ